MTDKEAFLDGYLRRIAVNLDISDTMREKAERSYRAVGEWLGDCGNDSSVRIMPQGSFYLGTVIRPVSDADEYDIDLVCLLKNEKYSSEAKIKNTVGDRLKEHERYSKMLQKEGKRCWTLNYDEFHMDILPCVPNNIQYSEPYLTEIKLTHKLDSGAYIPKYSNPYRYHKWFEDRMQTIVTKSKRIYAEQNSVEIEKVPLYKIKTPLQRAVQLLKRHRDILYSGLPESRKDNAPISIIITTLAAHAYNNEDSIYEALKSIVCNMEKFIEIKNEKYIISNPVMENENFAEKWNVDSKKADEFFYWLKNAKETILEAPLEAEGLHNLTGKLEACFGKNIVQRAVKEEGESMRTARNKSSLFIEGLDGGLKTQPTDTSKKVGGHTFFGK